MRQNGWFSTCPLRGVKSGEMTQMECGNQFCSLSHDNSYEIHRSYLDTRTRDKSITTLLQEACEDVLGVRSHHLYWTCSACWVWWSLCCHGCWWQQPWTGTSAEVSGLTEPHPRKGPKNTQRTITNWREKKQHLQLKINIRKQRETASTSNICQACGKAAQQSS